MVTRIWVNIASGKGNKLPTEQMLTNHHIDGLVQHCSNSIANALELLQSCTKPSMWSHVVFTWRQFHRKRSNPYLHTVDVVFTLFYLIWVWKILIQGGPFHKHLSLFNSNSINIQFHSHSIPGYDIITNICTWHDSCAVVSCANFCSDQFIRIWARTKKTHRIWIMMEKLSVKWAPGHENYRADSRLSPSQWETSLQSNAVSHWLGET